MEDYIIEYVDADQIFPKFGVAYCSVTPKLIYIRKDLPKLALKFLKAHEMSHLTDNQNDYWLYREFKANWRGFLVSPIGCMIVCVLSLHPSRIRYYIERFRLKQ